jgi:DNA-binding response OmpR family regulator
MSRQKPSILIVDDDEDVLITLEHVLETEGYRTATAWGGREALTPSDQAKFDLMLINEHISDLDLNWLVHELQRKQPRAMRLVMCARREDSSTSATAAHPRVCKWEHSEVKEQIRSQLASA